MAKPRYKFITSSDNPINIIWRRQQTPYDCNLHWHDDMEIQCIKEGVGCYFVEGTTVSFRKNSVIVIQPREIHRLLAHLNSTVEKWCIVFDIKNMDWPSPFLRDIASLKRHIDLLADEAENIEQIICKIVQENKDKKPRWKSVSRAMLTELLLRIKRSETNKAPNLMRPIVSRALDYIEQYYRSSFNVGGMAKHLHISERHLFRLFEADVGMPIKHYVLQRRVFQAQRMIRSNPAIKLEAVSEAVGFNQYSLFSRIFKKFIGVPPRAHGRI